MDVPSETRSPQVIRWLVPLSLLLACAALAILLVHGSPSIGTIHTVALLAIALSAYAWMVAPAAGSTVLSLIAFVTLAWADAARRTPLLHGSLAAFALLIAAAGWQRRRRFIRLQRMSQRLEDLREERTVKDQAIAATNQAREALQKKLARYTQLQQIAEELGNLTDLHAIAELAVTRAFSLIGKSDVCLLFLVDPEPQELSLIASKKREAIPAIRAKHGDQFDRHVLRTHRPLLVNDVRRDFRFTVTVSLEREVNSVIACPLLLGQSPAGVLRLDSAQPGAYTQDDLRFLDILLDLVSTAVTNAKLFAETQRLAMTDGLTGLTLRRPFLEQLGRELTRASRGREPVSLILLDVDHFKTYNDTFGHTAGDLVLKAVAEVLRTVVPPGGAAGRYGGEEFVVLLPRLPRAQAAETAEKIRQLVAQQVPGRERARPQASHASAAVRSGGSPRGSRARDAGVVERQPVTVSLGVASFPDDAQADLELIRVADERLYQAKAAGRNLVVSA
ncbi:MAG: sensor domain-containing diguanylate cyclase [Candidatus Omnitrophica bacterium]|nr:sensor domain-containing diguanylate cyclase [Candidatus Omnitrophota bacterium]